jgi:pilus assembly protein CpaC
LGAERGKWSIAVKLKDGEDVTYLVKVESIRTASAPLSPGVAPAAMSDDAVKSPSPAVVAPLDSGAGPVVKPATENEKIGALPSARVTSDPAEAAKIGDQNDAMASQTTAPSSSAVSSQTAASSVERAGKFITDPSVASSGDSYTTEGVASSGGSHFLPADGISMMNGTSQVIDFPARMRRVSIADTEVADVQVINPFELNLIGHKPGFTTLTVWTGQGHYEERQVRISPNGKQQVMLNTMVAEVNRGVVENQGANLSLALQHYGVSLVGLPGAVGTPYTASSNLSAAGPTNVGQAQSSGGILPFGGQLIPLLLSQGLTYGLSAQNSNVATQSFFQYLENHNMAKILAQPRLLANSGEEAKFVDGGEIPIVVAQALNTSIVFKEFGTKVTFVPTVVGVNDVELLVKPEVSEPDFAHGVALFGFQVPAFVTRRAETQVRLKDNQTLIVAGLILHEKKQIIQKVPYLGDIPYAGGLFRNTDWQDTETDLVMSVTPEIVRPLPSGGQVYLPTSRPPLSVEEIKTEKLATPDAARPRF